MDENLDFKVVVGKGNYYSIELKAANEVQVFLEKEIEFWNNVSSEKFGRIRLAERIVQLLTQTLSNFEQYKEQPEYFEKQLNEFRFIVSSSPEAYYILELIQDIDQRSDRNLYNQITTLTDKLMNPQNETAISIQQQEILNNIMYLRGVNKFESKSYAKDYSRSVVQKYDSLLKPYKKDIDVLIENFQNNINEKYINYDKKVEDYENQFNEKLKTSEESLNKLKDFFHEYIRLKEPAKYWEDYAKEYDKKGKFWLKMCLLPSVVLITFSVFMIICFNRFFPSVGNPETISLTEMVNIIKWILLVIVTPSILFYFLRLFIKFANSNFHMSMDSKERLNLTHYYLALKQGEYLEPENNLENIIIQSLFGRAETGLLKGDSRSSLPSGITAELAKILK